MGGIKGRYAQKYPFINLPNGRRALLEQLHHLSARGRRRASPPSRSKEPKEPFEMMGIVEEVVINMVEGEDV